MADYRTDPDFYGNYDPQLPGQEGGPYAVMPSGPGDYRSPTSTSPLDSGGTRQPDSGGGYTFNLPTDIFPYSESQSTGSSSQAGSSSSNSYSGLPSQYRDQLLAALMPQLNSSVQNMEGNIDQYTNQALGSYQQSMQNALKHNIPAMIQELAKRGIINSTVGGDALGTVGSNAAIDASTKGYETSMQAALLKSQMPTILSQIAQLGQSQTANAASESSGGSTNQSSSYQEDPTVMYREMSDLIKAMM